MHPPYSDHYAILIIKAPMLTRPEASEKIEGALAEVDALVQILGLREHSLYGYLFFGVCLGFRAIDRFEFFRGGVPVSGNTSSCF